MSQPQFRRFVGLGIAALLVHLHCFTNSIDRSLGDCSERQVAAYVTFISPVEDLLALGS